MKLRSLALQNFRQHADSLLHFPESGIIAIVGQNEGGKSTILEAIAFALYGTKAIRGSKDGLRWKRATARKQAEVALEFDVAGNTYIVQRSESDARVFGPGMVKVAAGTSAVNEYLPTLIGMGLDEFRHTFLAEQKQLATIAAMKGVARRQFFLEVLGVGKVDEALEACRKRKNSIATEVEGASKGLGDRSELESEVTAAESAHTTATADLSGARTEHELAIEVAADAHESLAASDHRRRRHEDASREHASAVERHGLAQSEVQRASKQLEEARAAAERVAEREAELAILPELVEQRDALRAARSNQDARVQFQRSIERAESEQAGVLRDITAAEGMVAAYQGEAHERAEAELAGLRGDLTKLAGERATRLAEAKARREQAQAELKKTERKLEAINVAGAEGSCPTCLRVLADAFDAVIRLLWRERDEQTQAMNWAENAIGAASVSTRREAALSDDIADLESVCEEYRSARTHAGVAEQRLRDLQKRRVQIDATLAELRGHLSTTPATPFNAGELARLDAEVTRLQALDRALQADRALAGGLGARGLDLANRRLAVAMAEGDQHLATQKIAEINFRLPDHELVVRAAQEAQRRREEAAQHTARFKEATTAAEARVGRASGVLAAYDLRAGMLEALRADLRTHEQAAGRLADFRAALASSIRPELESLVSGLVSTMTDGRHECALINDEFEITLMESGVPVEVISGGTEDVVALALRIAISQMISERAGHPLSLLILDEPLTSLDEVRRAGALDMIRRLRSVFVQVIIVSHIPEIRESADHTIEISFDEASGCSRVSQPVMTATITETVAA